LKAGLHDCEAKVLSMKSPFGINWLLLSHTLLRN